MPPYALHKQPGAPNARASERGLFCHRVVSNVGENATRMEDGRGRILVSTVAPACQHACPLLSLTRNPIPTPRTLNTLQVVHVVVD